MSLFRKSIVIYSFLYRAKEKIGQEGREIEIEIGIEKNRRNRERFVGGCDESKSGSHWTELRKSVDREDRRSGRRRRRRR